MRSECKRVQPVVFAARLAIRIPDKRPFLKVFICLVASISADLSRIRSVHQGDLAGDLAPFEFSLDATNAPIGFAVFLAPLHLHHLLPLEELVGESEVGLDDDIESPSADEAIRSRERQAMCSHYLSDADGGATRNPDSAMDKRRRPVASATI